MSRALPRPVRGRQDELNRVQGRLEDVTRGIGTVVVVEGQAGLGKTALLEASASMAARMSFRVGSGRAEPGRSAVDLEPFLAALFDGNSPVVSRDAASSLQASVEHTFWLLQDLESLIEEAALEQPVLLTLDDLHWAGSSSALAMRELPERLAAVPVAWIMTFRPNQGDPLILEAKNEMLDNGAEFISLGPLARDAVVEVATDILGARPDERLLQMAERVHGSPFLLVELFRGLLEEDLVALDANGAVLLEDRVPQRVGTTIQHRLARMSPAAEQIASLAASLGRRFSLRDLAEMISRPVTALVEPVHELLHAGIFADRLDHLEFWHDLIREGVRASTASPVRRALDRQAVDVLVASGALPIEVAHQLAASAEPGDDVAVTILLDACNALSRTDPAAAADLAGRALALTPPRHPLRGPLVSTRAISMFAAGNADDAKHFADAELREALSADDEARVRGTVAGMFDLAPDMRAENARRALALPGLGADQRARSWTSLFHAVVVAVRTEEALQLRSMAREAVQGSETHAGRYALAVAESVLEYQLSNFAAALRILDGAERPSEPDREDSTRRRADDLRASYLVALDRFDEAFDLVEGGIAAAQRDRQNWALRMFETWRGRQLLQLGRLEEAALALDGRYPLRDAQQIVGSGAASNIAALGKLKMHIGDHHGANELADVARVMLKASAPGVQHHAAWYLALHAMCEGNPTEAHRWLCVRGERERLATLRLYPMEAADGPSLVRIALAVGDDELARSVVGLVEHRANANPDVRSLLGAAAHAKGLWQRSVSTLETAASLFADSPRPLAAASAWEDLGRLRADEGAITAATAAFDHALRITTTAGASWDAARLRRRLRTLGVRRRVRSAARAKTGWASLTTAELAVTNLAIAGNTNREIADKLFISPHTVNTHLRHVYDKLGVHSRVGLSKVAPH